MKKTTSDGRYRSVPNSQESGVATEGITYESALRKEGIDEAFVARKLKDLLRAQGRRWNPKKGSWEKFEDYGTQLAALREIAKIFGIYAKDPEDTDAPVVIDLGMLTPKEFRKPADGKESEGSSSG